MTSGSAGRRTGSPLVGTGRHLWSTDLSEVFATPSGITAVPHITVDVAKLHHSQQQVGHIDGVARVDLYGPPGTETRSTLEGRWRPIEAHLPMGEWDWQRGVEVLKQLLEMLARLDAYGVPHGGITPANIVVNELERVGLLEVGLAAAVDGEISGRWRRYQAPERLAGAKPTFATDAYSVGAVFFQAYTGVQPFPDSMAPADRRPRRLREVDTFGDYPHLLEALVMAMLAPNPEDRPTWAHLEQVFGMLMATTLTVVPATRASADKRHSGFFAKAAGPMPRVTGATAAKPDTNPPELREVNDLGAHAPPVATPPSAAVSPPASAPSTQNELATRRDPKKSISRPMRASGSVQSAGPPIRSTSRPSGSEPPGPLTVSERTLWVLICLAVALVSSALTYLLTAS